MTEIRVEVPDARTGFLLFKRIVGAANVRVRDDRQWEVLISADGHTEDVLSQIRVWLTTARRSEVVVYLDGDRHTLLASD